LNLNYYILRLTPTKKHTDMRHKDKYPNNN